MRSTATIALLLLLATSARAKLAENVAARSDPTQTYTLYLPTTYDASKKHPLLLVFDPRGRGTKAAEIFRDAAEEYGWIIISSNQTRSDGSNEPNERALRALLPETAVYASDPKRIYAAGFSGTAMLAWAVGMHTGSLAGVIGVGGRLVDELPPAKFNFAHYGFAGTRDFNYLDMRVIDELLTAEGKVPHRFTPFDAEHRWITPELAREAIGWMEVIAGNEQVAAKVFAADVAAADALQGLAALRRYRAILRTHATFVATVPGAGYQVPAADREIAGTQHLAPGTAALDAIRAKVAKLESDPQVQRALKDEKTWDDFERRFVSEVFARIPTLFDALRARETPLVAADVARSFRVKDLRRRSTRDGAEGVTARRLLEAVFTQCSFYLPPQLFSRREYALAAAVLGVAADIHSDRWDVWYNLAAAQARNGQRRQAFDALERAIANGFSNAQHLATDEDFASVRGEKRFQEIAARLR